MLDQKNIQGDIWPRLPKKAERFVFFRISNVPEFKSSLPTIASFITTSDSSLKTRNDIYKRKQEGTLRGIINLVSINIAFSAAGLDKLGAERFNDEVFNGGQFKDMTAPSEGETAEDHQGLDPQGDWVPEFKPSGGGIDGVLVVAGNSLESVDKMIRDAIDWAFNVGNDRQSIEKVYTKTGTVYQNHLEHFGWVDGISQPKVKGLDELSVKGNDTGMAPIDPGIIIVGHEGDQNKHPEWAKDGSFMVFRIYEQLVPEFYYWCSLHCPTGAEETKKALREGKPVEWSERSMDEMGMFSSRLVGRWPAGAPMELHPKEDPNSGLSRHEDEKKNRDLVAQALGKEGLDRLATIKQKNETDAFNYNPTDQTKCPYVSHMRKTGPRNDHGNYTRHLMMRRGIPYGPWCQGEERSRGVTEHERGLLFVSYQSSIDDGFRTQQKRWANAADGPTDMAKHSGGNSQGIDPIVGQVHPRHIREDTDGRIRAKYRDPAPQIHFPETVYGEAGPQVYDQKIDLARLCIPHGGEYFFSPSISALKDYLPLEKSSNLWY